MAAQTSDFDVRIRVCRWGLALSLVTVLFGFGLGGAFGGLEEALKSGLQERAAAVRDTVYAGDEGKVKSVLDKSWVYYQRAHLHGGGIGAATLGAIIILAALRRPRPVLARGIALALGLGGLGYAVYWLLAARAAPGLGSTAAARQSLEWLAVPSAALLLVGMIAVIALTIFELFAPPRADTQRVEAAA